MVEPVDSDINQRVAAKVRALRAAQSLSLDALAARCGVSRSALSLIERAESSATAVVLDKLAAGLGVPLASLFAAGAQREPASPLARFADQALWRDPGSGYLRRSVSPSEGTSPIQLVEVHFPARTRVAYESVPGDRVVHQQVWVLEGRIDITVDDAVHRLHTGDCLAFSLERPTAFFNPTRQAARYAVVVVAEPVHGRR